MASDINQALQDLVNQDDDYKIKLAAQCYFELLPTFKAIDPETDGLSITGAILATTIAADGKFTQGEYDFIQGMLSGIGIECTEEEILDLVQIAADDLQGSLELVKSVRDRLDDDGITSLVNFVAAVCSIDDKIDRNEVALIKALI